MPLKSVLVAVWLLLAVPAGAFAAAPAVSGDSDQSWSLVLEALDRQDKIVRGRLAAFNVRRAAEAASFAADGRAVDAGSLVTHQKALEYQRHHPGTEYMDAVRAVS